MKRFSTLALGFALAACSDLAPPHDAVTGPHVELRLSALTLSDVGDVVWDIQVENGADDVVVQRRITSSAYGDSAGSAALVTPCDASVGVATNTVSVWVVGLYQGDVASADAGQFNAGSTAGVGQVTGAALDFVPVTADGPLTRDFVCVPDADTRVAFDVTLSRPAHQGFFDVAVQFDDIFCSAKLDCESAPGVDLDLLHDPGTGRRDMTAVLGLACTADVDGPTYLYLDDPTIDCSGLTPDVVVDPGGRGVVDLGAAPSANPGGYLFSASVFRGLEGASHIAYWNISFGLDEDAFSAAGACTLTTRATASTEAWPQEPDGFPLPADTVHPVIHFDVPLTTGAGRACTTHALGAAGTPVSVVYEGYQSAPNLFTWSDAPLFFDNRFDTVGDEVRRATGGGEEPEVPGAPLLTLGSGPYSPAAADGSTPGDCSPLSLTNVGDATGGGAYALSISGDDAGAFSICQPDADDLCQGQLAPGESCTVGVALIASTDGAYSGQLNVETVDALFANRTLQGLADNLDPEITQPVGPLAVHPVNATTGSPGPCTALPVTNTGSAPGGTLDIAFSGADAAHFAACEDGLAEPCDLTFEPGETCDLGVQLLAAANGSFTATATVGDGVLVGTRQVTGIAYGLAPVLELPAGPIHVADLTTQPDSGCVPLVVTNTGNATGGGSYALTFSGADRDRFSACTDGLSAPCGAALGPGGSCQVGVRFTSIQTGTATGVARLTAAGGLTATATLTASATGASLLCPYVGPGWCRSYSYPYPSASTLTQALALCDADPDCVGVSTYRWCIDGADDTCGNGSGSRSLYARCTDLDFSVWPDHYATFVCPAPVLSLGAGVKDLGSFTGGSSGCVPLTVTNEGTQPGGGNYALTFAGGAAADFTTCTAGLSNPCSGALAAGASCELGVRVVTSQNGVLTTTASLSADGANAPTRSLRATSGGLVAQLTVVGAPVTVASLNGSADSGCVPVALQNTGTATGGGNYGVSFTGGDAQLFSACAAPTNRCMTTLAPGATCNVGVRYIAVSDSDSSTTLRVTAAGGLTAQGQLLASATGLGSLTCPYLGPGWCSPYDYPYATNTTLGQAMAACTADPTCIAISTYQSCTGGPASTCALGNRSGYARCTTLNFSVWPTNYATYVCGAVLGAVGLLDVDPIHVTSGGACTPLTVDNNGAAATTGAVVGALSGPDAGAFAMCTTGLTNPCSGALAPDESCQLGVRLLPGGNGEYDATLTVSAPSAESIAVHVSGDVSGREAILDVGDGPLTVTGFDGGSYGPCTPFAVTNTGFTATTAPLTVAFSGVGASRFAACTDGVSSPCGATLAGAGGTCNLGVRLQSSVDGTFEATMHVASVGALSDARPVQGTAVNAAALGATVSALHIDMGHTSWIGIIELQIFSAGTDLTDGMTVLTTIGTGFPAPGEIADNSTYSTSLRQHAYDDGATSNPMWNSSSTADWDLWFNFGAPRDISEIRITWSEGYGAPPQSLVFMDQNDNALLPSTYETIDGLTPDLTPATGVMSIYQFTPPILEIGDGPLTVGAINGGFAGACTPFTVTNIGQTDGVAPIDVLVTGPDASRFQPCFVGVTNPCQSQVLDTGASCGLGLQLVSGVSGTFDATVTISSPHAESDARPLTGTATNASAQGIPLTGLQIDMAHGNWIGIQEIVIVDTAGQEVTQSLTPVPTVQSGFGVGGTYTSSSTYNPGSLGFLKDHSTASGILWNSNQGAAWDLWYSFGTAKDVAEIRINYTGNYGEPPNSIVFRGPYGAAIPTTDYVVTNGLPPLYGSTGVASTYDFSP